MPSLVKQIGLVLFLMSVVFTSSSGWAEESSSEFDALGGNREIYETLQALQPDVEMQVVQKLWVPRAGRVETLGQLGIGLGGDTYVRNRFMGLGALYHMNDTWAVGVSGQYYWNTLTPEGEAMVRQALADYEQNPSDPQSQIPQVNYLRYQTQAFVQWSPLYGKLSWLGRGVSQFNVYTQLGVGQVALANGSSVSPMAGLGMAVWMSPRWSARIEGYWQNYQASYRDGNRDMNLTQLQLQLGRLF